MDGIEIGAHQGDALSGGRKVPADFFGPLRRDGAGLLGDIRVCLIAHQLHAVQPQAVQFAQNPLRSADPQVMCANTQLHRLPSHASVMGRMEKRKSICFSSSR